MSYIVTSEWLKNHMKSDLEDIVIVDVRFKLTDADAGRKAYNEGHLPQAVYLDLNKDLSGPVEKHGGNHPLPDVSVFAKRMGEIGIDHDTTVVIYDRKNEMYAARMWWLLQYLGHEKVYLLDGGYTRWVDEGNKTTTAIPTPKKKEFKANVQMDEVVNIGQVKEKMQNKTATLIDSRAKDRYLGKVEPLYGKAGHIPGAKLSFWKNVLRDGGLWKSVEELQTQFANFSKDDEIIVSCGSGVSACPNIAALKMAGYKNVKLYPGSFGDWISYEENEIETTEE